MKYLHGVELSIKNVSTCQEQIHYLLNKLIRFYYLPLNYLEIKSIFASLDERLFSRVTNNPHHVLRQILPPVKSTSHDMRRRRHKYTKTTLPSRNIFSSSFINFFPQAFFSNTSFCFFHVVQTCNLIQSNQLIYIALINTIQKRSTTNCLSKKASIH